jgi:SAM-dependent methyltransferase
MRLLCPNCRESIAWGTHDPLRCAGCGATYPVVDGIPTIRNDHDYYHGLLPKARMREMLQRSRTMGWEAAFAYQIAQEPSHRKEALREVLLNENRAAFKTILDGLGGKRVLDLGCGSGSTSINLARWAGEVVGCDLTWERVAFLAMRARALGLANLRPLCGGDTRPLPFLDGSFDCVVLNGVLEWSAAEGTGPVRAMQRDFLKEVRRILRPDGQLYIGIENRLGLFYFLGQPEDHTGVKYAALAPRWLADVLVRRARGHPYRTYTYSRHGCQTLLREAGYRSVQFYAPVPDYRNFQEIVALDAPMEVAHDGWAQGARARLKRKLLRNRWLTPSFGIVASPGGAKDPWIKQLADYVRNRTGIPDEGMFPRVRLTAASSAGVIAFLGRSAILRVPLDPANEIRVRRNFEGLGRAKAISSAIPELIAPEPLLSDTFQGVPYTVESFVEGRGYRDLRSSDYDEADRRVFDFLLRFKSHLVPSAGVPHLDSTWRTVVIDTMQGLADRLSDSHAKDQVGILRSLAESMEGELLPVAFGHGDFWWGNILLGPDPRLGLVDWDGWSETNFVTNDLLHFACYRRVLRSGAPWERVLIEVLEGRNADLVEQRAFDRFAAALRLPNHWKRLATIAYWVREVSAHGDVKLRFDPDWTERVVNSVLPALIDSISRSTRGHA